ncbi:hypothetical protein [Allostreptomyces psammosilenae]|uniref:Secreted protein n=1 Tax=Allostreptomyces psammosilenae TaxID=1892865 RepID=A0A853ACU4_9ACTN|nr:hypothetical protein [Allostreptomyces psammosilenae]NYI08371.1 hypothetical protein [Allostreptomyces psammosilenae]
MTTAPGAAAPVVTAGPASPAVPAPRRPGRSPATGGGAPDGPRLPRWLRAVLPHTTPGRLRGYATGLVLVLSAFAVLGAMSVAARQSAAADLRENARLSTDAGEIHRLLADADAAASAAFLAGSVAPPELRQRYDEDIARAAEYIVRAAESLSAPTAAAPPPASGRPTAGPDATADPGAWAVPPATVADCADGSGGAREQVCVLNSQLPVYTGLVETARANNRQDFPLGGAYLRTASQLMRDTILPAAEQLYRVQSDQVRQDQERATEVPWAAVLLGVAALALLGRSQLWLFRHTHRVLNPGLAGATVLVLGTVAWLVTAGLVSSERLQRSEEQAFASVRTLTTARAEALQARGAENMTLVLRGAGADFEADFVDRTALLDGREAVAGSGPDPDLEALREEYAAQPLGGGLGDAAGLAEDGAGRELVARADQAMLDWRVVHQHIRAKDDNGEYPEAVELVGATAQPGPEEDGAAPAEPVELTDLTATTAFAALDQALGEAIQHEYGQFDRYSASGQAALAGLAPALVALAALAGTSGLVGLNRRLAEYR